MRGTVVGDNLLRGVSGGEKKRVTIAEAVMGCVLSITMPITHITTSRTSLLVLDDYTKGLDSLVSLEILKILRIGLHT